MKTIKLFAVLAIGLAFAACTQTTPAAEGEDQAGVVKTSKDFTPSKAVVDSVSYLVGINFGSFIKGNNFGDLNFAEIKKGIEDFISAEGSVRDEDFGKQFKIDPNEHMSRIFNAYLESRFNYQKAVNKESGDKYLASNAKKEGVQTTESGLQYKILEAGNDVKPASTDTVWVKYCGKTIDGNVFDETPADSEGVRMMLNRVIPGWTEGLQLIGEGGKIQLTIPSDLGYGEQGNQGIEPNSVLLFDVEIVKVGKATK